MPRYVIRRPYAQMQSLLDGTQPKDRRYYWKSEYLPGLDPKVLETAVEQAKRNPSPHSAIVFFQLDGALNELPADHSPVGNRDAKFVCNAAASWDAAADDATSVGKAWQAMRPFSTGGVYVNFLTEDEGADRTEAAYGRATLERLAAMKRKLDPENLFSHTKRVLPG